MDVSEFDALAKKATPLPWNVEMQGDMFTYRIQVQQTGRKVGELADEEHANAILMQDGIPMLVAERDALRKQLAAAPSPESVVAIENGYRETVASLRAQVEAMKSHPREFLGRTVRAAWLAYCKETGRTDKPSYVASWEDISEWDREVDRQIGEAVRRELIAAMEEPHAA